MDRYERTKPVYQLEVNEQAGIPYVVIGDGGNREGFATPWNDPQPPCVPSLSPYIYIVLSTR